MKVFKKIILVTALILANANLAQVFAKSRTIEVTDAWIRYKPAGIRMTGAFMNIRNKSNQDDSLISASSKIAAVEIHQTKMNNGIMSMDRVDEIAVSKGKTAQLKPGSYHIMLIGIKKDLKLGDKVDLTLKFKKSGSMKVSVPVIKK